MYAPPERFSLPILQKAKAAYALWHQYHQILEKSHRYSLGQRIDSLFIESLEAIVTATFLSREEKLPFVQAAIRKLDTLKLLLLILWETKSLDTKKYTALSTPLDEIGRMLGGWSGQLQKQNSPAKGEK
ncbi:MAG: four helix bundle protein [Candidatus Yanofskybacteria bacterium]|nr:four helix bundle protein [Candidatus Yanofskybacteria bacterium]